MCALQGFSLWFCDYKYTDENTVRAPDRLYLLHRLRQPAVPCCIA